MLQYYNLTSTECFKCAIVNLQGCIIRKTIVQTNKTKQINELIHTQHKLSDSLNLVSIFFLAKINLMFPNHHYVVHRRWDRKNQQHHTAWSLVLLLN
jgi:hypothetical protein